MRVLLVEDDSATAASIELMLRSEGFICDTTDLGEDGLEIGKLYPDLDVIVLDLGLPDIDGYEVLRRLRLAKVRTPVLILSGKSGIDDRVRSLGYGADDFVPKPVDSRELVARLQAIVRRSQGHATSVVEIGSLRIDLDHKTVETADGAPVALTRREFSLLEILALRKGQTVTKEAMMTQLYSAEADDEPEMKIIDVYVHKIRRKLEQATGERYIETVWGRGYALKTPADAHSSSG
jgi:two-component system cell cycle response regulator CtrA